MYMMIYIPHITQCCCSDSYDMKPSFRQIVVVSSIGLILVILLHYRLKQIRDQKIIPRLRLSRTGHTPKLERFSHYVGKQICNIFYYYIHWSINILSFGNFYSNVNLWSTDTLWTRCVPVCLTPTHIITQNYVIFSKF